MITNILYSFQTEVLNVDNWAGVGYDFNYGGTRGNLIDGWSSYEGLDLPEEHYFPEIQLFIESEEIVATTRKLKMEWTYELEEDYKSVKSLGDFEID